MFSKTAVVSVTVIASLNVLAQGQEPTLAERVEASGGKPVTVSVLRETAPIPIRELSAQSDLVVAGRLVRLKSYVSENKKQILTDYQVVPQQVLFARGKDVRERPGPALPIVLTVLGGQVKLNGVVVTMVNEKLRPIKNEGQFLLFATRLKVGENHFQPTHDSAGIFEMRDDQRLEPLFRRIDADPEVNGVPFEEILRRIRAAHRE